MNQKTPTQLANHIYKKTTNSLMAHSIKAVENFILEEREVYSMDKNKNTIKAFPVPISIIKTDRITRKASLKLEFTKKNILLRAVIFIKKSLSHNETRVLIAHELAHLLLDGLHSKTPGFFQIENVSKEADCDEFAEVLCQLHHKFYENRSNIENYCLFQN